MLIGVLSDSHDQIVNLHAAINHCNEKDVEKIIHCGDLISPFMLKQLTRFHGEVHLIYGNNVGDLHLISQLCATKFENITHHGPMGSVVMANRTITFHHYPEVAKGLAATGQYDVVCCGHNHIYGNEIIGSTLLINPGDLLGKDIRPCFSILDTETLQVEKVEVGTAMFADRAEKMVKQ